MSRFRPTLALTLAAALLAGRPAAQTGPFADGELLLLSTLPGLQTPALHRIDPETGASAVFRSLKSFAIVPGLMSFDAHRGGVFACVALDPDFAGQNRLWFLAADGSATKVAGLDTVVRSLHAAGDGRLFFQRHSNAGQGPRPIEFLDASDQIVSLKQADGITPYEQEVEHLLYHPATNSLIASTTLDYSAAGGCGGNGASLFRIPLSSDGLRVSGPVTCITTSILGSWENITSLELLPDGRVLVATSHAVAWSTDARLRALSPASMTLADWADPDAFDLKGAIWSARLGRAVALAYNQPQSLRRFGAGEAGGGLPIATAAPMPWGLGLMPVALLVEADTNGPACDGFAIPYGAGLAGQGSVTPTLGALGCPDIGNPFTLAIQNVVGGASGILFVGLSSGALPFKGGTFHLGSVLLQVPIAVGGTPGVAGAGSLSLPVLIADPLLTGLSIYLQAGFLDAAAAQGVSLSNGLRVQAG